MLRMTIHTGLLVERNDANHLAVLDITHQKRAALADYLVALTQRQQGEIEPAGIASHMNSYFQLMLDEFGYRA